MTARNRYAKTASDLAARHTRAKRGLPRAAKSVKAKRAPARKPRQRAAAGRGFGGMWRSLSRVILGVIALSGVAIGLRSLSGSQLFTVKEIALEGNNRTSREELMALLEDKTGASLWKVNLEEIRKALKRNAWVRDAEVTRQLPDKLRVKINEREPYALARRSDNSVVWIDRDGTVLGDHSRFNREVVPPVISGLAEGASPKVVETNQRHLDLYQQLLAELDGQKPPLSAQVDEVLKVPAHDDTDLVNRGHGNVARIVLILLCHHARCHIRLRQRLCFRGEFQNLRRIGKRGGKMLPHFLRRVYQFAQRDHRCHQPKDSGLGEPEQIPRRLLPLIVEPAADHRRIEIERPYFHLTHGLHTHTVRDKPARLTPPSETARTLSAAAAPGQTSTLRQRRMMAESGRGNSRSPLANARAIVVACPATG